MFDVGKRISENAKQIFFWEKRFVWLRFRFKSFACAHFNKTMYCWIELCVCLHVWSRNDRQTEIKKRRRTTKNNKIFFVLFSTVFFFIPSRHRAAVAIVGVSTAYNKKTRYVGTLFLFFFSLHIILSVRTYCTIHSIHNRTHSRSRYFLLILSLASSAHTKWIVCIMQSFAWSLQDLCKYVWWI